MMNTHIHTCLRTFTCFPMQCLMAASKDDKDGLDKLVMMNTRLVGLCASHDSVVKDQDKMAEAAELYRWGVCIEVVVFRVECMLCACLVCFAHPCAPVLQASQKLV